MVESEPPLDALRRVVARRIAALLFVAVFLLDVLASPGLLPLVNRLCD
jgi:hypothetical protein